MTVSIEAIALPNADRESELTTLVSTDLALEHVRDYQLIARRNFFGRDGAASALAPNRTLRRHLRRARHPGSVVPRGGR